MNIRSILFLAFIVAYFRCYSQNSNELRTYYDFVDSELLFGDEGIGSHENDNSYEIGLRYLRKMSKNFSVETGINFFKAKVSFINPESMQGEVSAVYKRANLRLISIPIYANYSFGKYFYINGGSSLDFQIGQEDFRAPRSGLGFSVGAGAKYSFNNFVIYVSPNFKINTLVRFKKEVCYYGCSGDQRLIQRGFQVGVGYKF